MRCEGGSHEWHEGHEWEQGVISYRQGGMGGWGTIGRLKAGLQNRGKGGTLNVELWKGEDEDD